jgi:hypothetical protein
MKLSKDLVRYGKSKSLAKKVEELVLAFNDLEYQL